MGAGAKTAGVISRTRARAKSLALGGETREKEVTIPSESPALVQETQ